MQPAKPCVIRAAGFQAVRVPDPVECGNPEVAIRQRGEVNGMLRGGFVIRVAHQGTVFEQHIVKVKPVGIEQRNRSFGERGERSAKHLRIDIDDRFIEYALKFVQDVRFDHDSA